jgi:thiamine-phosphate pyrophosphorylase
MENRLGHGLYAITDVALISQVNFVATVDQAIQGGARVIQYRDKSGNQDRRRAQAGALQQLCRSAGIPFIVNDDVELAGDINADGVHLGKGDTSIGRAREVLGATAIIGASCYDSLDSAVSAAANGVDYVAFGSFFPSRTKPHALRANLQMLRQARRALQLPIVAIFGITPANGGALLNAGADILAGNSGVFGCSDVRAAAKSYAYLYLD